MKLPIQRRVIHQNRLINVVDSKLCLKIINFEFISQSTLKIKK